MKRNKSGAGAPAACPCGTGLPYAGCCAPRHDGRAPAPTAEALMRSRYSAYVLGLADYLLATWHPDTRPAALDDLSSPRWLRLAVRDVLAGGVGDDSGEVEFDAYFKVQGRAEALHERSRFRRVDGRWVYVDALPDPASATSARMSAP